MLDAHWFDQRRMDLLRDNVLLVLMPVFFLSTGLRTQWGVGGAMVFVAAALFLVAAVAGKLVGVGRYYSSVFDKNAHTVIFFHAKTLRSKVAKVFAFIKCSSVLLQYKSATQGTMIVALQPGT